jgi:two-component SAPR family response regulator
MNTADTALEIRVLGQFSIMHAGRPLAKGLAEPQARELFCNLLSPQGDSVTRDRLCRSLWQVPVTNRTAARLAGLVIKLNAHFSSATGIKPIIEKDGGFTFDHSRIWIDANCFYQVCLVGLQQLSVGNHAAAVEYCRTALSLYGGPFLPGFDSTIICQNRECLHSLYLAIERFAIKQGRGRVGAQGKSCLGKLAA